MMGIFNNNNNSNHHDTHVDELQTGGRTEFSSVGTLETNCCWSDEGLAWSGLAPLLTDSLVVDKYN